MPPNAITLKYYFTFPFRSKGDAQAMFLRHEGFLGALGAFVNYNKQGHDNLILMQQVQKHKPEPDGTTTEEEDSEYASIDCSVYID